MNRRLEKAIITLATEMGFPCFSVYTPTADPDSKDPVVEAIMLARDEATLLAACRDQLGKKDK